jgi:PilZ domain
LPLLGAFELRRITRTLAFVGRRRQLRGEYRTPIAAGAVIVPSGDQPEDAPSLLGRMHDITTGGVGFELSRPLPVGTLASLTVQLPDVGREPIQTKLQVAVRSCLAHGGEWRIGAAIVGCEEEDRRRVLSYCNVVWPYRRLRGEADPTQVASPHEHASSPIVPREATLA